MIVEIHHRDTENTKRGEAKCAANTAPGLSHLSEASSGRASRPVSLAGGKSYGSGGSPRVDRMARLVLKGLRR